MMAQPPDAARVTPAALFEEAELDPRVHLIYKRFGDVLRVAYDPMQTTRAKAEGLLTAFHGQYADARVAAITELGRTIIADLPVDEDPVRITTDANRRVTVVFDDRRISPDQLLDLMAKARA
ncbi:hypothetical protein [Streptomyces sp. NPDC059909]|uniref:hypothetical protein n=1 Tax=Streptomyces sp. NPDC059909 TaxID=3346998 RepID=UPI003648CE59